MTDFVSTHQTTKVSLIVSLLDPALMTSTLAHIHLTHCIDQGFLERRLECEIAKGVVLCHLVESEQKKATLDKGARMQRREETCELTVGSTSVPKKIHDL